MDAYLEEGEQRVIQRKAKTYPKGRIQWGKIRAKENG